MTRTLHLTPGALFAWGLLAIGLMFRSEGLLVLALVGLLSAYRGERG